MTTISRNSLALLPSQAAKSGPSFRVRQASRPGRDQGCGEVRQSLVAKSSIHRTRPGWTTVFGFPGSHRGVALFGRSLRDCGLERILPFAVARPTSLPAPLFPFPTMPGCFGCFRVSRQFGPRPNCPLPRAPTILTSKASIRRGIIPSTNPLIPNPTIAIVPGTKVSRLAGEAENARSESQHHDAFAHMALRQ